MCLDLTFSSINKQNVFIFLEELSFILIKLLIHNFLK